MSRLNFDNVELYEDTAKDIDIIKTIIETENDEEPFCILDVANVVQKHQEWIEKMPKVVPHYAIKCNPDPTIIKVLVAMNASFDCASESEIRQVMKYGVTAERIIFAHPAKLPSHIKYARKMNVQKMTADSESELVKISELFPEAKVVIRIRCDAISSLIPLGSKFGCDPNEEAVRLIHLAKRLNLTLHGFSFHVGSMCGEINAYSRGISMCKRLINTAVAIGCKDVQLIDIGGGFPGDTDCRIDKFASVINDAIQDIDPSITIISEPGQYYVSSAITLASYLHTKKVVPMGEKMIHMYYMNCGLYSSFILECELFNLKSRTPIPLHKPTSDEKFPSILWGPTLCPKDNVLKDVLLPKFQEDYSWTHEFRIETAGIVLICCNTTTLPVDGGGVWMEGEESRKDPGNIYYKVNAGRWRWTGGTDIYVYGSSAAIPNLDIKNYVDKNNKNNKHMKQL